MKKVEIKSEGDGVITNLFASIDQKLDVGADFVEYDTEGKPTEGAEKKTDEKKSSAEVETKEETKKEQPKEKKLSEAERFAEPERPAKKDIPQPKSTKEETKSNKSTEPAVGSKGGEKKSKEQDKETTTPYKPPVLFTGSRNERVEPMSRMRQRIAQRLKDSQNTYATLSTFNEIDMSESMRLRSTYQEEFSKKYGTKLGFMSIFLKAATTALQEMPVVNAVIKGNDIVYRDFVDISVAVATPTGLMVPIIRNCESKNFADFELILKDLSVRARDNKIGLEDLQGGTFTISNGGVYGSLSGTPIINPPQTAILGMHRIDNRPVVRGNEIVARPMM